MFVDQTPAAFYGRNVRITTEILQVSERLVMDQDFAGLLHQNWFEQFNGTTDQFQEHLLAQTFDNPIFASCSMRMKYQEGFLKTILKWVTMLTRREGDR